MAEIRPIKTEDLPSGKVVDRTIVDAAGRALFEKGSIFRLRAFFDPELRRFTSVRTKRYRRRSTRPSLPRTFRRPLSVSVRKIAREST